MPSIPQLLIIFGIALLSIGIIMQFGSKYLPLGKLPGDFVIDKGNFKAYFPLATSIILSLLLTLIFFLYKILTK
ncbi:MAG: DUF2905 domain-containing protein [Candidatus Aenigmarchaeota archaeon]|nr:DUF2905 domain-containing protein [Candidatus Aenigmarchaeota archaeon]